MKKLLSILIAISILITGCTSGKNEKNLSKYALHKATIPKETEDELSTDEIDKYTDFSKTVATELLTNLDEKNKIFSPFTLYQALSMLSEITRTDTKSEIMNLLNNDDQESLRKTISAFNAQNYQDDKNGKSLIANSVWLVDGYNYNLETLNNVYNYYNASSFMGDVNDSNYSLALRDWIDISTGGILKGSFDNLEFSKDTVLFLLSAIYFKSAWVDKFNRKFTKENTFTLSNGKDIKTDFMNILNNEKYVEEKTFKLVNRKFKNEFSISLILPNENISIDQLFFDETFNELIYNKKSIEKIENSYISLSIPKFEVSNTLNLNDSLKELGIIKAFDFNQSDFTPLKDPSELKNLKVSKVLQGSKITIDEDGGEAGSFTSVEVNTETSQENKEISFNRPFIFILYGKDNLPLFIGVLNNPIS